MPVYDADLQTIDLPINHPHLDAAILETINKNMAIKWSPVSSYKNDPWKHPKNARILGFIEVYPPYKKTDEGEMVAFNKSENKLPSHVFVWPGLRCVNPKVLAQIARYDVEELRPGRYKVTLQKCRKHSWSNESKCIVKGASFVVTDGAIGHLLEYRRGTVAYGELQPADVQGMEHLFAELPAGMSLCDSPTSPDPHSSLKDTASTDPDNHAVSNSKDGAKGVDDGHDRARGGARVDENEDGNSDSGTSEGDTAGGDSEYLRGDDEDSSEDGEASDSSSDGSNGKDRAFDPHNSSCSKGAETYFDGAAARRSKRLAKNGVQAANVAKRRKVEKSRVLIIDGQLVLDPPITLSEVPLDFMDHKHSAIFITNFQSFPSSEGRIERVSSKEPIDANEPQAISLESIKQAVRDLHDRLGPSDARILEALRGHWENSEVGRQLDRRQANSDVKQVLRSFGQCFKIVQTLETDKKTMHTYLYQVALERDELQKQLERTQRSLSDEVLRARQVENYRNSEKNGRMSYILHMEENLAQKDTEIAQYKVETNQYIQEIGELRELLGSTHSSLHELEARVNAKLQARGDIKS